MSWSEADDVKGVLLKSLFDGGALIPECAQDRMRVICDAAVSVRFQTGAGCDKEIAVDSLQLIVDHDQLNMTES